MSDKVDQDWGFPSFEMLAHPLRFFKNRSIDCSFFQVSPVHLCEGDPFLFAMVIKDRIGSLKWPRLF